MKLTYLIPVLSLFLILSNSFIEAQTSFDSSWELLNQGKLQEAIASFEEVLNDATEDELEQSLLALMMLYSDEDLEVKAAELTSRYYEEARDPLPAIYATWFMNGVVGSPGKKKDHNLKLLNMLDKSSSSRDVLGKDLDYTLGTHHLMALNLSLSREYFSRINHITDWQFVGPFDNVVNAGYNKDFGVLGSPQPEAKFKSKYGGEVAWNNPQYISNSAYEWKSTYENSSDAIIYAQKFIETDKDQEVLLSMGYSGSLKVWINDQVIYSEPELRSTTADHFQIRFNLPKGKNRLLVQLGNYEFYGASFTFQLSDMNNEAVNFKSVDYSDDYNKELGGYKSLPSKLISAFKAPKNDLDKILLAKVYSRSGETDKAEKILLEIQKRTPNNYILLQHLYRIYNKGNKENLKNETFDHLKKVYPNSLAVISEQYLDAVNKRDLESVKEYSEKFKKLNDGEFERLTMELIVAALSENIAEMISLADTIYSLYPENYEAMEMKYNLAKSYKADAQEYNQVLRDFIKHTFNAGVIESLAANYIGVGELEKALELIDFMINVSGDDPELYRKKVNILSKQEKYKEAINECNHVISLRPTDYQTHRDLGVLNISLGNTQEAIKHYEEALKYYPFSYEDNEKIRSLKALESLTSLSSKYKVEDVIKEYEASFQDTVNSSYNMVLDNYTLIIEASGAKAVERQYIFKIKDESAIEQWQNTGMGASAQMNIYVNDMKTIKANGASLEADQNGADYVFTNLEIGDYIFIDYTEKQYEGGKSSAYLSDVFYFDSYVPTYHKEFNVIHDKSQFVRDTVLNGNLNKKVSTVGGMNKLTWVWKNIPSLADEPYSPPYNDVATQVHISNTNHWGEIVDWYSDLTAFQSRSDNTIREIASELTNGAVLSEREAAKKIYEFIVENIQYSSVDFRQSGVIPQKASKVYETRLGDCKDVSTLYKAVAEEMGLNANLVLINTRDNGEQSVMLPSLNFNHCIVQVEVDSEAIYLELTDNFLPFGSYYSYHEGSPILIIDDKNQSATLEYLPLNRNIDATISRDTKISVDSDGLQMIADVELVGTEAATFYSTYYNLETSDREVTFKGAIEKKFQSAVDLTAFDTYQFNQLEDELKYKYEVSAPGEVNQMGSFKSFKIPFGDVIMEQSIVRKEVRDVDVEYRDYEVVDHYSETITIKLSESDDSIVEIPESTHYEYDGNVYDCQYEKVSDKEVKVIRTYKSNLQRISAQNYEDFREFATKIINADNVKKNTIVIHRLLLHDLTIVLLIDCEDIIRVFLGIKKCFEVFIYGSVIIHALGTISVSSN